MDYDEEDYRRLGDNGEHEKRLIKGLIISLMRLRDQSHPKLGDESAAGKDLAAFRALSDAGKLVDSLAGWAIDHQIGLALKGLQFVPLGHPAARNSTEYAFARDAVDSHEHEREGAGLWSKTIEPAVARRIAANLLGSNAGAMHHATALHLEEALRALDLGFAPPPMVQPAGDGRKVKFKEQRQQLKAIGHWKFREATEVMTSGKAKVAVTKVYGVSAFTLGTWETRLRTEIGALEMSNVYAFAEGHASYVRAEPDLVKRAYMVKHHHQYGDDVLAQDAADYDAARRA